MNYIYPIILSLIPAFHLYLNNRVPIKYAYPSWVMIGIVMGVLIFLISSVTKSQEKAGVIAAAFAIGFFYFELIAPATWICQFHPGHYSKRDRSAVRYGRPPSYIHILVHFYG